MTDREFIQEERLKLLDEMFRKLREMMQVCDKSRDFQSLTVSAGILIDKYHLETGDVTDRTAVQQTGNDSISSLRELLSGKTEE